MIWCRALARKRSRILGNFWFGSRLDSWLYRIVQTLWVDGHRKQKVRAAIVDPEVVELSDGGYFAALSEGRMMLEKVRVAMDLLPEAKREVLPLVALEGLSYGEAGEVFDLPVWRS